MFNKQMYKEDILGHPLYLETLYDGDTNHVAENVIKIIQDSLDKQAPVQKITITPKK